MEIFSTSTYGSYAEQKAEQLRRRREEEWAEEQRRQREQEEMNNEPDEEIPVKKAKTPEKEKWDDVGRTFDAFAVDYENTEIDGIPFKKLGSGNNHNKLSPEEFDIEVEKLQTQQYENPAAKYMSGGGTLYGVNEKGEKWYAGDKKKEENSSDLRNSSYSNNPNIARLGAAQGTTGRTPEQDNTQELRPWQTIPRPSTQTTQTQMNLLKYEAKRKAEEEYFEKQNKKAQDNANAPKLNNFVIPFGGGRADYAANAKEQVQQNIPVNGEASMWADVLNKLKAYEQNPKRESLGQFGGIGDLGKELNKNRLDKNLGKEYIKEASDGQNTLPYLESAIEEVNKIKLEDNKDYASTTIRYSDGTTAGLYSTQPNAYILRKRKEIKLSGALVKEAGMPADVSINVEFTDKNVNDKHQRIITGVYACISTRVRLDEAAGWTNFRVYSITIGDKTFSGKDLSQGETIYPSYVQGNSKEIRGINIDAANKKTEIVIVTGFNADDHMRDQNYNFLMPKRFHTTVFSFGG